MNKHTRAAAQPERTKGNRLKIGGNRLKLLREGQRSASRKFIVVCELCRRFCQLRPTSMRQKHGYAHRRASQIRMTCRLPAILRKGIRQATSTRGAFRRDLCGPHRPKRFGWRTLSQAYRPGRELVATAQANINISGKNSKCKGKVSKNFQMAVILSSATKMTNITLSHEKVPPPYKRRPPFPSN